MDHIFARKHDKDGFIKSSDYIGVEERIRLKIRMGEGCDSVRKVYRGDQLEHFEKVDINNVHVLNEIVLDRGPSPYSVQLDLSIFDVALTHSVGDGVIVSTPTGSTAYNLSAGGSIVETTTKCMCLTPLAPHSLSFRPIILPDSSILKIEKSQDNRTPAWVSLDGANRFQLLDGESIIVEGSEHPLRMVTLKTDNLTDLWAQRLVKFFGWNTRQQNKPLQKK